MTRRISRALGVGIALLLGFMLSACDRDSSSVDMDRFVGDWQNVDDPSEQMRIAKVGENFTVEHQSLGTLAAVAKDGALEVSTSIGPVKAIYEPSTDQVTFTAQFKRATPAQEAPSPAPIASQDVSRDKPIVRSAEEPSGAPVMDALTFLDAIDSHGRFHGLRVTRLDPAGSLPKSYGLVVEDVIIGADHVKFQDIGSGAAKKAVLDAYQKQGTLLVIRDGERMTLKGRASSGGGASTAPDK